MSKGEEEEEDKTDQNKENEASVERQLDTQVCRPL